MVVDTIWCLETTPNSTCVMRGSITWKIQPPQSIIIILLVFVFVICFFPDFPKLLKGAFFKLSLVINQCFLRFGKDANGLLTFDNANCQITSGGLCPLLVASSYTPTFSAGSNTVTTVTSPTVLNRPCGSALLPLNDNYEVSLSILRTQFTHTR